jgi:hypothetical protein
MTCKSSLFSLRFLIFDKIFKILTGKTLTWNFDERFLKYILDLPKILGLNGYSFLIILNVGYTQFI